MIDPVTPSSTAPIGGPFPCCPHCTDDPDYHEDGTTGHDSRCTRCDIGAGTACPHCGGTL